MTIEFFVNDCLHDVDVHFGRGRDARDLGGNFGPMQEFTGIAARTGPRGQSLRLIVCGSFVETDEPERFCLPAAPDRASPSDPAIQTLQHRYSFSSRGRSSRNQHWGWMT